MKHKLFLCILILVVLGLYCKNYVEYFSDDEKKEIIDIFNNQYGEYIKLNNQNSLDAYIDNKIEKIECDQGPQGPKGDTGGQANVYQGLYSLANSEHPLAPIGLDKSKTGFNTESPINNPIELNLENKSQFKLTNRDRWQYTIDDTLVSGYSPDFKMCYNDDGIYACNSNFLENNEKFKYNFKYKGDTQQFLIEGNKCVELDNNKLKVGTDCKSGTNPNQKFFLH